MKQFSKHVNLNLSRTVQNMYFFSQNISLRFSEDYLKNYFSLNRINTILEKHDVSFKNIKTE